MFNRKLCILLISNFIVLLVFGFFSSAKAQSGDAFLDIADKYRKFADFSKALDYCNKAIDDFKKESLQNKAKRSLLSKAFYLKASILNALQASEDQIKECLVNALIADSEYEPSPEYISHPHIIKLMNVAKDRYYKEIKSAYNRGVIYFAEEKYCLALKTLKPISSCCENPDLAMKIIRKSEAKCEEFADSAAKPPSRKKRPRPIASGRNKVAVFPVICKDYYKKDRSKSITGILTKEAIFDELNGRIPKVDLVLVSDEQAESVKNELDFKSYEEFIVRRGQPYHGHFINFGAFLKNGSTKDKNFELALGELPPNKWELLKKIGENLGVDIFIFVRVKNQSYGIEDFNIEMDFNVYDIEKTKEPVIKEYWPNIPTPSWLNDKPEQIGKLILKYYK
jgi:hypothetical protein